MYRLILKNEREKQFLSIENLQEEIKSMKCEVDRPPRNKSGDFKEFEFGGSFGGDELSKMLHQDRTKLTLPKISLDSVLDMQKSESFVNRC